MKLLVSHVRGFILLLLVCLLLLHSPLALADATNPTLSSSTPSDNAYAFSETDNIVLTFSETLVGDESKITLYKKQGDTEVGSTVVIDGSTVTINPDADLSANTGYYVNILAAALDDEAGNSYAGITSETGLNFSTASFDGLEGGNLAPTSNLEHTEYKSISVFSVPLCQGQFLEYDPNDGFGNWFYFYKGISAISGDLGTELYSYLDDQSPDTRDEVNDMFKPDTSILWCCSGQDDHDGNTSTNRALFRHNTSSGNGSSNWGLQTQNKDGDATTDWDIGNNSTNTRLVRWLYDTDGYLKAYHNNPGAGQDADSDGWLDFARAQSRDTYTASSGNSGYFYLAFANKNDESHDTPMTFLTPPTLSSMSPADNATGVATTSNIVLNFSEAVDAESGNISIFLSDGTLVEEISVTGGQVSGSGTTQITINPADELNDNTSYYVQIPSTAFDNSSSNSYCGVSDTTTLNFTTVAHTATPTEVLPTETLVPPTPVPATATSTVTLLPTSTVTLLPTSTVTLLPTNTATLVPTATETSTATLLPTSTATSTLTSTPTPTARIKGVVFPTDTEATDESKGEEIGFEMTPGPEGSAAPPSIVETLLAQETATSALPAPLVVIKTATPIGATPSPTTTPPAPTSPSVRERITTTLSNIFSNTGNGRDIIQAINASFVGTVVEMVMQGFLPEPIHIPASPTPGQESQAKVVTGPVQPARQQDILPSILITACCLLLLIIVLPLVLAICFAIFLCKRGVTKASTRYLLSQLPFLGSLLIILYFLFASSPGLLEAISIWTVAVMIIVFLLEEAILLLFVVMQRCDLCWCLLQISVEDHDVWRSTFDQFGPEIQAAGSKYVSVFCNQDDPNKVTVLLQFSNLRKACAFRDSDEIRETIQRFGLKGPQDVYFLEDADGSLMCGEQMTRLIYLAGQIYIEDYEEWRIAFHEFVPELKAAGSEGEFVFRNADEPNQITVLLAFPNMKSTRAFMDSDKLREIVHYANSEKTPTICILDYIARQS